MGGAKIIPATEASEHVGETVTVTGHVDGVKTYGSGLEIMNLDGQYPHQQLAVIVRPAASSYVGDLTKYDGKDVVVEGTIGGSQRSPAIEVTAPGQIRAAADNVRSTAP